jgi:hypothetical protein
LNVLAGDQPVDLFTAGRRILALTLYGPDPASGVKEAFVAVTPLFQNAQVVEPGLLSCTTGRRSVPAPRTT